ncbi:hypothetical protein AN477_13630 [Alicyclobacillus ferrooxydans]|uniref:Uncharacterized protein n=1 Tax=Alicyclobacillus ferrooxydans TaxID=471514 RepID=A0A0P9CCD7_9BACL|nr:hypothetical protein AN477_13630 [Alicyclobacillus ferrooxydans]
METEQYVRQTLLNGLHGRGSHVNPANVCGDLNWRLVAELPNGIQHSIWQIVNHMILLARILFSVA